MPRKQSRDYLASDSKGNLKWRFKSNFKLERYDMIKMDSGNYQIKRLKEFEDFTALTVVRRRYD